MHSSDRFRVRSFPRSFPRSFFRKCNILAVQPHCFHPPKPFWKKTVYSGSSAARHKRTNFTNAPLNIDWILEAIGEVPKLEDVSSDKVYVPSFDLVFRLFHQTDDAKQPHSSC